MPPVMAKLRRSFTVFPPRSSVTAPAPLIEATLNENAWGDPMCGFPSRLKRMRSIALASVAVPTVERTSAPIRCWSTRIAVVSPSRTSTSGRARVGMKPCTKALYVSLISRCDSAAIVPNTSELLPEPETPVNTVSRRFGISRLMSLRLFTRAPCTRIKSWLSPACSAGDRVSVLVAMFSCLHLLGAAAFAVSAAVAWLDLISLGQPARPSWASGQPAAVAHQLAAGQLVHFAPSLDAARGDAEGGTAWPAHADRSRCARRTGHPAPAVARRSRGPRLHPRSGTRRGCGPAPAARPGPRSGSCRSGCPPAWPLAAPRRPHRRTAAPDTAHRPPRHWPPRHRCRW